MNEDTRTAHELRAEIDNLRARVKRLAALARQNGVLYSHAVNSRNSIVAAGRMCSLLLREDFTVASTANAHALLGPIELGAPVTRALRGPAAEAYFESLRKLGNELSAAPDRVADVRWEKAFPIEGSAGTGTEDWTSVPPGSWEIDQDKARLADDAVPGAEHYLVSPWEIVPPGRDFRIEYRARAEGPARDLSLVVGTRIAPDVAGVHAARPDSDGYSFAFGAVDNQTTELQRRLETIAENENVLVVPGTDHHCLAERIGGQLRFEVDGREALYAIDCLPLIGEGYGHVGLYTCAPLHTFWGLTVWTRPSCLPEKTRQQIESLRKIVLDLPDCPARRVEIHYMGKKLFLLRDVTRERLPTADARPSGRA